MDDFYRHPTGADGHMAQCKTCKKAAQARYRNAHIEEHRARNAKWQRDTWDIRKEYQATYRKANKDKIAAVCNEWRNENADRMRQNRKIENARRRARIVGAGGSFTRAEWVALKEQYGNKCLSCGRTEAEVKITPDHVIPLALGGSNTIDNIQPLCWSCNAAKQARVADYRGNHDQLSEVTPDAARGRQRQGAVSSVGGRPQVGEV